MLNGLIASIWLINGLFCKIMDLVPRHQMIVAKILQVSEPVALTRLIGVSEVLMACWIIIAIRLKTAAIVQILVIGAMNILEYLFARELLLWGSLNIVFAFALILVIYWNEFVLQRSINADL